MSSEPTPTLLGLPKKFKSFRTGQWAAFEASFVSDKRVIVQNAPTGFGKSLLYMTQAMVTPGRTVVLTATKALQDQLIADFKECGMVDIRGQNNYPCAELEESKGLTAPQKNCDSGPCHGGYQCPLQSEGCTYFDLKRQADTANILVTNYAYWLSSMNHGSGLGKGSISLLICDEAQDAPDQLCSFLAVSLDEFEMNLCKLGELPDHCKSLRDYQRWSRGPLVSAETTLMEIQNFFAQKDSQPTLFSQGVSQPTLFVQKDSQPTAQDIKQIRALQSVIKKLRDIISMRGDWVLERSRGKVTFDPVWPKSYRETLFHGIPKIVLSSATVRKKTCALLGIDESDIDFFEYPSTFPIRRRPVILVGSSPPIRVDSRTEKTLSKRLEWVRLIDQIISNRLDRKGKVDTVSYSRAQFFIERSKHRDILMHHHSGNTARCVQQFREATAPTVLVSPVMTTGYDFPMADCEYSIISKVPFPDSRGKIMQARLKEDPEYGPYLTMQIMVQTSGRGMRSEGDQHETFIVDDHIRWFLPKHRNQAPKWWLDAVVWKKVIPSPPESLTEQIPTEQIPF